MSKGTPRSLAETISLKNHGVIEAHAGTGKTYTIIQMVLRMLREPLDMGEGAKRFIHIREILLVTFTDKAAGELRRRIREGIEERIAVVRKTAGSGNGEVLNHLENCLNNLHEALIGTIHGICLRLLQASPFETGVHFKSELVDDAQGLESSLRESMRTDWQNPDTHIPWALERLVEQGSRLEEKHYTLVRQIAQQLLDGENTVLDRITVGNNKLKDLWRQVAENRTALDNPASIAEFHVVINDLVTALVRLGTLGKLEPDRLALLHERVAQMQAMCLSGQYDKKILRNPCKRGNFSIYTKGHCKKISGLDEIDQLGASLVSHEYLAMLMRAEEIDELIPLTLINDAAELLCDRWVLTKRQSGFISFQDMLRLMHQAVFISESFCKKLRERLCFGIIDEFQDTSILQWQIFKKIFLDNQDSNGPRLFIVGDPKQSIYSFQGSDVNSYLDAKHAIIKNGGSVESLIENFRSLAETIQGYNTILRPTILDNKSAIDWFGFDSVPDGEARITYSDRDGTMARSPVRNPVCPCYPLSHKAVQVMVLVGSAAARKSAMARQTSRAIQSLRGTMVSIPCGTTWEDKLLHYQDFAVIAESHSLAESFLEQFKQDGIPAVKYKMGGVFQSPMARDIHALLRAVTHKEGDPAHRLAALLTRFFNYRAAEIDPEHDLEPCHNLPTCGTGQSCLAHALFEWSGLSEKRYWAQLFRSILERTGIRERLIKLIDGDRTLADLRQIIDYGIEKLYCGNFDLPQLVEHLGRLLTEEETVAQDKNLHVLATEKSSVKVLTMHASKGLEFPVVFVATAGSKSVRNGPNTLSWIDRDYKKKVVPYLSSSDTDTAYPDKRSPRSIMVEQATRERRRLLYVALTRAQAMLFVPMHLEAEIRLENGTLDLSASMPKKFPDTDLTPQLNRLIDNGEASLQLFSDDEWKINPANTADKVTPFVLPPVPDLLALNLASRICRQTSYSQISRQASHDRDAGHSEEKDYQSTTPTEATESVLPYKRPLLPGGRNTGDALHLAIEEVLEAEDIVALTENHERLSALVKKYLDRNSVLAAIPDPVKKTQALDAAAGYIKGALEQKIPLPSGESVAIASLKLLDRKPEMEFLLGVDRQWLHGYMDLVFRVPNARAKHPWKYYVLDWKSDQLPVFSTENVAACIKDRHYDFQATIYCHALEKFLKGIVGSDYDAGQNLGGAVYVFLRGYHGTLSKEGPLVTTWLKKADSIEDENFLFEKMNIKQTAA